jgi:hypothetical protein
VIKVSSHGWSHICHLFGIIMAVLNNSIIVAFVTLIVFAMHVITSVFTFIIIVCVLIFVMFIIIFSNDVLNNF